MLTRKMIIGIVVAVLVCMNGLAWGDPNYWYVDPDGNDLNDGNSWDEAFATIQKGLNTASDGDTVEVNVGTYVENIYFDGNDITLTSTDPKNWEVVEATTIDANGNYGVLFWHVDANSILRGFRIINSRDDLAYGAIICRYSYGTITRCIFENNGKGINLYGPCSNAVINNIFSHNKEAIYVVGNDSTGEIKNNWIYENSCGIFLHCTTSPVIRNNTIVGNSEFGIDKWPRANPQPSISNCILWHNGDDLNDWFSATYSCIEDVNDANGDGNITDDPCFVNIYDFIDVTDANGTKTTIIVADANLYDVDDVIEYDDDEVVRTVTDVNTATGTITFDTALNANSVEGTRIRNWGVGATDVEEDLHLDSESLCINAGDPNGNYSDEVDIDHEPRVINGRVDMGGDETWNIDLDVDTNRDGNVTDADDDGEDTWGKGPGTIGAIVLPNCDKDNTDTGAPDNWIGGDWDKNGVTDSDEGPNYWVDNANDINDLAPLWVSKLGCDSFPDDLKIILKVEIPTDVHNQAYFAGVPDCNRIRIFMPTDDENEPNNLIIKSGDLAIIGPNAGNTFDFNSTSNPNYNVFLGSGIIKFGVEGNSVGSYVDITTTLKIGEVEYDSDTVRMRVAPFVLADYTMPVDVNDNSDKTVFVSIMTDAYGEPTGNPNNIELRNALRSKYVVNDVNHLDEVNVWDPNFPGHKQELWQNDGYEVGYVKAPYGHMPIFLVLPRAKGRNGMLLKYVHNYRLKENVGVCSHVEDVELTTGEGYYSCGGNINSKPGDSGPGHLLYSTGLDEDINDFFEAQAVNPALKIDWSYMGHCDSVIAFSPFGHTIVADPEVCWALLVCANSVDPNALMRQGMIPNPDWYNLNPNPNGQPVSSVINGETFDTHSKLYTTSAQNKLDDIRQVMELPSPESIPYDVKGSDANLSKAGAFIGLLDNKRWYRITFQSSTDYSMKYRDDPNGEWIADNNSVSTSTNNEINTSEDCVFRDAKCFILAHWWKDDTPQAGDKFEFDADPNCKTIEMPQLHCGGWDYTINHMCSVYDSNTVFTGRAYGPEIDYSNDGNDVDILMDYVKKLLEQAGYDANSIIDVDSRQYHNLSGSIWCGTNVQRAIPDYDWWHANDPN